MYTTVDWNQAHYFQHIRSDGLAKRGLDYNTANRTNIHTPMWKKSFKTQHGRIPLDPALWAANWTSYITALKTENEKMLTSRSEATRAAETTNRRPFFGPNTTPA